MMMTPLSIIVPVLDEAGILLDFLTHLRERAPAAQAELIVVDGGSADGSYELACGRVDALHLRILRSPRGRAQQMNAGARAAGGEILWFLHADSRVPRGAGETIRTAFAADPNLAGGCFRLGLPREPWIYRVSDSLGNAAVDLFRIALGDHGIFCRRAAFDAVGGFPEVPLMEDAEFYRALRRFGRVRQLRSVVATSPRRYEQHGRYRTTAVYALLLGLYWFGVNPRALARMHRWLMAKTRRRARPGAAPTAGGAHRALSFQGEGDAVTRSL